MATVRTTWFRKRCGAIANIDLSSRLEPAGRLFTILRNLFRSDYGKLRREVEDAEAITRKR